MSTGPPAIHRRPLPQAVPQAEEDIPLVDRFDRSKIGSSAHPDTMRNIPLYDEEATESPRPKSFRSEPTVSDSHRYNDKTRYKGIDAFGRKIEGVYDDRCIRSGDGKFVPLVVQSTQEVLASGSATWARRSITPASFLVVRVSEWVFSSWTADDEKPGFGSVGMAFLKSVAVIPMMVVLLPFYVSLNVDHNFGKYDSVPYRYYGRAKKSRNNKDDSFSDLAAQPVASQHSVLSFENQVNTSSPPESSAQTLEKSRVERTLLPRRLCFLNPPYDDEARTESHWYRSTHVGKWMERTGNTCPDYLFIGYITSHFPEEEDVEKLHELARQATQDAGLQCYWVSQNCFPDDDEDYVRKSLDIWRISDVMRGASGLVVAVREPGAGESIHTLLRAWAGSIWTLPELLLSPDRDFKAYHFIQHHRGVEPVVMKHTIAKNRFASAYALSPADGYRVRRLIDHYLGSLRLSEIELLTVALQCFSSRTAGSVGEQYLPGDYSYAMMGLVSRRPHINPFDSAFLAFARLSLGNYNDRLFERFLCLLPVKEDQDWHNTEDAYGAQLWEIEPHVQVAGIGVYKENERDPIHEEHFEREYLLASRPEELGADPREILGLNSEHGGDTDNQDASSNAESAPSANHSDIREDDVVILDGCFAAKVHWNRFRRPVHAHKSTILRKIIRFILWINLVLLITGLALVAQHLAACSSGSSLGSFACDGLNPTRDVGIAFLVICLVIYLVSPAALRQLYRGKIRDIEPGLYGFEGYLPVEKIESLIFGVVRNRLTWSSHASSPLALRKLHEEGWILPEDPCNDPWTRNLVERARSAGPGDMRVFTMVDTYSMTATLFEARRPPEVLLICGSEGGMQRALACSFEWTTSTFYKETVLRLETRVLGRMDRIRRVRLGIKRIEKRTKF